MIQSNETDVRSGDIGRRRRRSSSSTSRTRTLVVVRRRFVRWGVVHGPEQGRHDLTRPSHDGTTCILHQFLEGM